MTGFAFSPARISELRRHPGVAATLLMPSESVREGRLRAIYREFVTHDEDGNPEGKRKERLQDVGPTGELTPARITVLLVERIDVYAIDGPPLEGHRPLDLMATRACGFKTVPGLRADWQTKHPNSPLAQLVWFSLGDVRDRDRFLQRWVWRGGDYTNDRHSAVDELPALSESELRELSANAGQRDLRRTADAASKLGEQSLAQRIARIEAAGEAIRREVRNELNIIAERAKRGRKKLEP